MPIQFMKDGFNCFPNCTRTVVDFPDARNSPLFSQRCKMYIGNMRPGTTQDDLRALFKLFGPIGYVYIRDEDNFLKTGSIVFGTSKGASMVCANLFPNNYLRPKALMAGTFTSGRLQ